MYPEKPKRKPLSNPSVYIATGIVIGMAIMGAALFLLLGVGQSATISGEPPQMAIAQSVQIVPQPTVIARRVLDARISPDGNTLAILEWDSGRALLHINQLYVARNLTSETRITWDQASSESHISFDTTGTRLLIASSDTGRITVLDTTSGVPVLDWNGQAAAFLPDGSLVIAAGNRLMRISVDGSETRNEVLLAADGSPFDMAASPDGRYVAVVQSLPDTFILSVYNTADWNAAPRSYTYGGYMQDLAFHPTGRYLAITQDNGALVLDLDSSSTRSYNFENQGMARAVAFSAAGDLLAIAGGDSGGGLPGWIYAVRWSESDLIPPYEDYFFPTMLGTHGHDVNEIAFTAEGYLLSASSDGSVRLWDVGQQQELSRFQI